MATMRAVSATREYMNLAERFPLVPIANKQHLKEAIAVAKELASRESLRKEEHGYFLVLSDLIESYEKKSGRLGAKTTPAQALRYLMEENGLTQTDLVPIVGHKSHLSAFLHGKRGLSKTNAIKLAQRFKVSPMLFLPRLEVI
jgi:HTH-type transcriptional regulator / antitoxin HigA